MTLYNLTTVDRKRLREIAYLAGVVDSDGWLRVNGEHYEVNLGSTDEDFINAFVEDVTAVTRKKPWVYKRNIKPHFHNGVLIKSNKPLIVATIVSKELYHTLKNSDNYVSQCPEAYIKGFADGDGSIRRKVWGFEIGFFNKDKVKLERVKWLLQKLGIESTNIRLHCKATGTYGFYITRRSEVTKYMQRIGFSIKRKMNVWKPTPTRMWAEEEIVELRKGYISKPKKVLLNELPKRTWKAIQMKAFKLGIRRCSL
jgi:intein-encoded DNA endonuclease-like protein